jgi:putative addiction module component (TIGR02574 family)
MNAKPQQLPVAERIRLVEDLWDSIAADQQTLPLTAEQRAEIDRRLDAYEVDRDPGRPMNEVVDPRGAAAG